MWGFREGREWECHIYVPSPALHYTIYLYIIPCWTDSLLLNWRDQLGLIYSYCWKHCYTLMWLCACRSSSNCRESIGQPHKMRQSYLYMCLCVCYCMLDHSVCVYKQIHLRDAARMLLTFFNWISIGWNLDFLLELHLLLLTLSLCSTSDVIPA